MQSASKLINVQKPELVSHAHDTYNTLVTHPVIMFSVMQLVSHFKQEGHMYVNFL